MGVQTPLETLRTTGGSRRAGTWPRQQNLSAAVRGANACGRKSAERPSDDERRSAAGDDAEEESGEAHGAGGDAAESSGNSVAPGSHGAGIMLTDPLGYLDFLCLMKHAAIVVTDSGGIQEETTCLGIPCVTLRNNTERPVTVDSGTNIIGGNSTATIRNAVRIQRKRVFGSVAPKHWDGHAADRILDVLLRIHSEKISSRQSLIPQSCT